jgi:hypothetical protein
MHNQFPCCSFRIFPKTDQDGKKARLSEALTARHLLNQADNWTFGFFYLFFDIQKIAVYLMPCG